MTATTYLTVPAGWTVLAEISASRITLEQALELVRRRAAAHPEEDVCMDGDLYAIVAKPRRRRA